MLKYVSFVLGVIISCTIIYYLKNLEAIDCRCALNFKHNYILYFTSIALGISVVNVLFGETPFIRTTMLFILVPLIIATITNIVYTIQYINDVKENKCECSESFIREGMYILAIINACVWILLGTFLIPMLILYPVALYRLFTNKQFLNKLKKNRPNETL
jgi:hypothetical protein